MERVREEKGCAITEKGPQPGRALIVQKDPEEVILE